MEPQQFKGARLALIHRTTISNERMVAITEREVVLSVRQDISAASGCRARSSYAASCGMSYPKVSSVFAITDF